jgi:hypothetical protein
MARHPRIELEVRFTSRIEIPHDQVGRDAERRRVPHPGVGGDDEIDVLAEHSERARHHDVASGQDERLHLYVFTGAG